MKKIIGCLLILFIFVSVNNTGVSNAQTYQYQRAEVRVEVRTVPYDYYRYLPYGGQLPPIYLPTNRPQYLNGRYYGIEPLRLPPPNRRYRR